MRSRTARTFLCLGLLSIVPIQAEAHPGTKLRPGTGVEKAALTNPAQRTRETTYPIVGARLIKPDRLQLSYHAGFAPCYGRLGKVEVRQNATAVIVTLKRVYPNAYDPQRACPQFRVIKWATVKLHEPLGERAVIDGSNGNSLSVTH